MTGPSDETLRRWLLQRLPPEESAPLEQRLLEDDAFGARVDEAETDLLDDLAAGRLDPAERDAAASRFGATPRDRDRLRTACALARLRAREAHARGARAAVFAARVHARRPRRRAAIAAAVCAAAFALVLAVGLHHGPPVAPSAEATIALTADRTRGASAETVRVPRGAMSVRLQIEVDARGAAYSVRIEDAAATRFAADRLAPREAGPYRFVEVAVPAAALRGGERRVRVVADGSAEASSWTLRIEDD